jgi:anti-sigma regulatory factor (Ser/Thr protein kinase)
VVSVRRSASSVTLPRPEGARAARRVPRPPLPGSAAVRDGAGEVLTLSAPSTARRPGERRPLSRSPREQLVALGLLAVVVHVVIVVTALNGLQDVADANDDVARIVKAQRAFQDADMAHDAILASASGAMLETRFDQPVPAGADPSADVLVRDVRGFLADLDSVEQVELPPALERQVADVRDVQDAYAEAALALIGAFDSSDPATAESHMTQFRQDAVVLAERQERVTTSMSDEADRRRDVALAGREAVTDRLTASAVVAGLGLLGITWLLHRLGGDVATLLARERGVAETLQHSLLPDRLPDLPGLRLAARYRAGSVGTQVGGDWYDVMALPGGRVGLVMGDVVGHDLRAASSMGQLRNALRACAAEGAAPAEVLERLNRLCVTQDLGEMATIVYAVLDPVTGVVELANAGHCPPLLVTADETRLLEAVACPPVGVVREAQFTSTTHALPAGSLLLLYTDGLVERRDTPVDDGLTRLQRLVAVRPDADLEAVCDEVLDGMLRDVPPDDDVALLLIAPQAQLGPHVDVVWPAQAERLSLLRSLLERWLTEAGADDDEVYDILVACSEAATNAVEHAYGPGRADIGVTCDLEDGVVTVVVRDWGQWREARGQDRGRGLGLMEQLMDDVQVRHGDAGTEVRLRRRLQSAGAPAGVAAVRA